MEELFVISKEDFETYFEGKSVIDKEKVFMYYKKKLKKNMKKHTNNDLQKLSHYYHTSLKLIENK